MSKKARRAQGPHRHERVSVPIGIEKLLCRAAGDSAFRQALRADRRGTVEKHGVKLTESEQRVFYGTPEAVLDRMIERIDLRKHGKRNFMKSVASVALAVSTTASISCLTEACTGIDPSPPEDTAVEIEEDATGDVEPDVPLDTDEADESQEDDSVATSDGPAEFEE